MKMNRHTVQEELLRKILEEIKDIKARKKEGGIEIGNGAIKLRGILCGNMYGDYDPKSCYCCYHWPCCPKEPLMSPKEPVLCYVAPPFAYFTTQALKDQWGDDWNDAPYEHNAGEPYEPSDHDLAHNQYWEITKIAYEAYFRTPSWAVRNSSYSVQDINNMEVPWLQSKSWIKQHVEIWAGATLNEFIKKVESVDGKIYFPKK